LPTANERGNNPDDLHKRHPIDFVLWQAHAAGEPSWQSPWGPGRPGWHIECSTLVQGFLGETIDIHGGGTDLMFPHHESEIAQSECATGRAPFARWWFHTAMVQLAGRKISKSLGNLIMVHDLLAKYSPDTIRLYLAGHHYRHIWQYDPTELESAKNLSSLLGTAVRQPVAPRPRLPCKPSSRPQAFMEALAHDLDTPEAVKILGDFAQEILRAAETGRAVQAAQHTLRSMSRLFGLRLDGAGADPGVLAGWNRHLQHTLTGASGP
jgi:L-cysteine:1D-myo-inositol 2-amino-2-deoxy-alpha-D-glucopyranoside ligase